MMVLTGSGNNDNKLRDERSWIGWFAIPVSNSFIRDCYLQYTNFLSLSDKELVIVSPVINVHTLRKKGEIKTMGFLTRLHSSLVL